MELGKKEPYPFIGKDNEPSTLLLKGEKHGYEKADCMFSSDAGHGGWNGTFGCIRRRDGRRTRDSCWHEQRIARRMPM